MEKAKKIRILILDVDGVLTDGSIIFNEKGEELKNFDVKDGHGIKLLKRAGIDVAFITGRESAAVAQRARELGITLLFQKSLIKTEALDRIIKEANYTLEEICYIGDDLTDLPILTRVGLAIAVSDGVDEVKEKVDYVTKKAGGRGAVREVCELIIKAKGKWEEVTERYYQ